CAPASRANPRPPAVLAVTRSLYAPALAWPAAVVGLRRDVFDPRDLEPRRLERADRRLAAGPWALDVDVDLLQPLLEPLARRGVGGHLGRERRRLARALESRAPGRLPRDHVAVRVGEGHDRVVERGLDVGLSDRDVLFRLAPAASTFGGGGHYFLPALFLPATCIR